MDNEKKLTSLASLCNYSGSSSDEESENRYVAECNKNTKKKLPVPSVFMNIHKSIYDETNDPTLHGGRIRSFPHQRGNWASYVYIPYNYETDISLLCDSLKEQCKQYASIKMIEKCHISLTRTFVLLYHWINEFVSTVRGSLTGFQRFQIELNGLNVYLNEEETRTFIGIKVESGKSVLQKIVGVLDNCLDEYKLKPFYEDSCFHVSIAWCLGNHKLSLLSILPQLTDTFNDFLTHSPQCAALQVDRILCKIGNRDYHFNLMCHQN